MPGGDAIVHEVNAEVARRAGGRRHVLYTQDWHPPATPHFAHDGGIWPVHCVAGHVGRRVPSRARGRRRGRPQGRRTEGTGTPGSASATRERRAYADAPRTISCDARASSVVVGGSRPTTAWSRRRATRACSATRSRSSADAIAAVDLTPATATARSRGCATPAPRSSETTPVHPGRHQTKLHHRAGDVDDPVVLACSFRHRRTSRRRCVSIEKRLPVGVLPGLNPFVSVPLMLVRMVTWSPVAKMSWISTCRVGIMVVHLLEDRDRRGLVVVPAGRRVSDR